MNDGKKVLTLAIGGLAVIYAVLAGQFGVSGFAYGVVGCAIVAMVLSVWGKLDSRLTPALVLCLGVAFLWQSTLISRYLIGTDIHTEYYFYLQALDGWDMSIPHSYNAAIGTTVIAPILTKMGIGGYTIYKVIYPLLFALVPVFLFWIYRKEFGEKVAFLGTLFFITLPTYTLEMIGLPRQMLGELMLGVVLILIIVRPIQLKYSVPLLCIASLLGYFFHYITGPAILMYLVGGTILLVFMKKRQFAIKWLVVVIAFSFILGAGYYFVVADGVVADNILMTGSYGVSSGTVIPSTPEEVQQMSWIARFFYAQEPLIRTAFGLDFMDASVAGKVFRIFQFLTQLCLILGVVWLIKNWRKISREYLAFTITAIALIGACVILPRFSNILNVTRFYHLALFLVSPLLIMGALYIFKDLKKVTIMLLIPYLLFTTGVIFEATQETDISKVNMPYSIALSNERVGMIGTYTENDLAVRDWAIQQDYSVILTDINGMLIMSEVLDPFTYLYTPRHDFENYPINATEQRWGFIPYPMSRLPEGLTYLVYLTEWNTENDSLVFKPQWYDQQDTASGMRQVYPLDFVDLNGFEEVYRQGNSVVLRKYV